MMPKRVEIVDMDYAGPKRIFCVTESMKDGRLCLEPIAGNQVACDEWVDLPIDQLHGYCYLLEKYLKGGED